MVQIFICPAASPDAITHLDETVINSVNFGQDADLSRTQVEMLTDVHPESIAHFWGSTVGDEDYHRRTHLRMQEGDYVLFYSDASYPLAARVGVPFENPAFARKLWGPDAPTAIAASTWQLMFSLTDVTRIEMSVAELNELLNYKPRQTPQGFNRIAEWRVAHLEQRLDQLIATDERDPATGEDLLPPVINGSTDGERLTPFRREQRVLKRALLGGRWVAHGRCAICGHTYPSAFLIAAHVKKRSECSEEERRDIPHVGMLACKFGCDALYEERYITVTPHGRIVATAVGLASGLTENLVGLTCTAFGPESAPYFAWHYERAFAVED